MQVTFYPYEKGRGVGVGEKGFSHAERVGWGGGTKRFWVVFNNGT